MIQVKAGASACAAGGSMRSAGARAIFAAGLFVAFAAAADVTLTGETAYEVASGATQTVSEKVTGSGSILKTGAGELILSNGANDFSGGASVSAGTLTATAEGALGSGAIDVPTASATLALKATATAADGFAVFANGLSFTGDTDVGYGTVDTKTGTGDGNTNVIFYQSTRLTGDVTATRSFRLRHNPKSTSNPKNGGPSTIFDGAINAAGKGIYLNLYGTMTANGVVTAARISGGEAWSGGGMLVLNNQSNQIGEIVTCHNTVKCGAANVLGGAKLLWRLTGNYPTAGLSSVNLAGFDQTVAGLSQVMISHSGWCDAFKHSKVGWDGNTYCVYSSSAATLTVTGADEDLTTYAPLAGAVSLVLDAAGHPEFTQTFTYNKSVFTGATEVRAGTLALTGAARFSKTPSVTVASGAKILCSSTAELPAFESAKSVTVNGTFDATAAAVCPFGKALETLVVGEGATLSLPEGSVLSVKSLTVGGETYASARIFQADALPGVSGAAIRVTGAATEATWTGAASQSLSDAGNWKVEGGLDLAHGAHDLVFAESGAAATVDVDAAVQSVTFKAAAGEAGFTLGRAEPAKTLAVGTRISALASDEAKTAHEYVIDAPLAVFGDVTLHADTNQTLVVRDALCETADEAGLHSLTVDGTGKAANAIGRVAFEGTNVFGGSLTMTTSLVRVSGALRNPGDAYTGRPSSFPDEKSINVNLRSGSPVNGGTYGLILDNATIGKSIFIDNKIGVRSITAVAGTTNEISGYVRYRNSEWEAMEVKDNAMLVLSGGLLGIHSFRMFGNGTMVIRDRPVDCQMYAGFNPSGRVVFEVAGNVVNNLCLGYAYSSSIVEMAVDNAFVVDEPYTNAVVLLGCYGGHVDECMPMSYGTHTWDLRKTVQRCSKLAVLERGVLTGEWPARLDILKGWVAGDNEAYRYVSGKVTGGVGLCQAGVGTLTITNALASCGDLAVTAGALEFADQGSWLNGTNVTVSGSGTLRLGEGRRFAGRRAVLHLGADGDSWKIDVPAGATHTFAALYDADGSRLSAGTYGSATSGAAFTRYASHFSGDGVIRINSTALVISVR